MPGPEDGATRSRRDATPVVGGRRADPADGACYLDVALPLPVLRTFTYGWSGSPPAPGTRVLVPFRRGEKVGWVVGEGERGDLAAVRPVLDVLEREPSVPAELLRLVRWVAGYYVAPTGVVLRSILPSVLSDGSRELVRLTESGRAVVDGDAGHHGAANLGERAGALVGELARRTGPVRVSSLRRALKLGSIRADIDRLEAAGLAEHWTEPPAPPPIRTRRIVRLRRRIADLAARDALFGRARRQRECFELLEERGGARRLSDVVGADGFSRSVVAALEEKGLVELLDEEEVRDPFRGEPPAEPDRPLLTPAQAEALAQLSGALGASRPSSPFLLHGVTGSGKTLVYIHLLREVVERRGRGAIVLVPEISLTPQTVSRFRAWFGERVAVLHSALSDGERYDEWRRIRSGEKRVVVGARSALFAPLPDLGAIVVDEEHDGSYKQSESPRYHARDVAVMRARMAGAICVLGSATPSLESWRNADRGKFRLLSLPERVGGRPLPPVEVIDLRRSRGGKATGDGQAAATGGRGAASGQAPASGVLSARLVEAVRVRLEREEQTILLLNRRGYSSFVQCRSCGEVQECPHCSVSLTFHRTRRRLLCHHCRYGEEAPRRCPACGAPDLSYRGLGTEQVERIVVETFPGARIARMDVDTTSGKWSHAEILDRVGRGAVDILLGTQMIAKGLDFPKVTLVGVVNADVGLHLPDFRASERTFQLLSQVAGRAGRGRLGGEVLIQTAVPGHYAIQSALTHGFEDFARRELRERADPPYPPLLRLVNVVVSSPDPQRAAAGAEQASGWVRKRLHERPAGIDLVGPAPSPIERLHDRWRWHFFIRGGSVEGVTRLLRGLVEASPLPAGDVRLAVDRDPVSLL